MMDIALVSTSFTKALFGDLTNSCWTFPKLMAQTSNR